MKIHANKKETIPWARPAIGKEEFAAVVACMQSGWLTCGPRVERFEKAMALRAGRKYAVAVSNGTAALDLALRVLGIQAGDEVIVPAFSYVATASAVVLQGATPVFADIDLRNLGMEPWSAGECVTAQTRAILCTDHGGNPCNYGALCGLAEERGIPLILDGAQSIGSMYAGRPTLSYGLLSTTSFHAAKTITTVEGGMVFTDDATLDRRMRMIRSQGEDPQHKYHHIELGHNFRMTELQAAIGIAQLGKLDDLLLNRKLLAANYRAEFARLPIRIPGGIADAENSFFLFSLLLDERDRIMARLKERGVETRACYPLPLYEQPIFKRFSARPCPAAEEASFRILNPPMFYGLTMEQQKIVAEELKSAIALEAPRELRVAV